MADKMLIDATHPEETRVVVVRGNRVEEFDFESANRKQLRGNIYLAKVTRVEPSLQAAFVDYGGNRHGFLAFSEIHPDYYQIPVADRQALLEQEARDQREADDEHEQRRGGGGRRRRHRQRGAERHRRGRDEVVQSQPVAEGDTPHEENGGAPADMEASAAPTESAHEHHDEPLVETVTEIAEPVTAEAPAADAEAAEQAPAHAETAPVEPASEFDVAHSGEAIPVEAASAESEAQSEAAHEGDDEDDGDDNGEAHEEEEAVESVGGADALEEVQERVPRFRRQYKIQEVIKRRQVMLVQVVKEERGTKGAALTTYLSLAGRYSVLMPNTARGGGISRKITSSEDRTRLKEIAQELEVPEGMGVILRTAGAARTKTEVKRDFEYLLRLWETVRDLTLKSVAPKLVYEEGSLTKRSIRDLYNKDIDEIMVAGEDGYQEARDFMRMLMPSHVKNVKLYKDAQPLFTRYGIESQLDAMFSPVVQLKSGGYIVINQAEALVAIDVNSGRATREHHIEDTALKTNVEAAEEIARQLRLRDLAGLIVIDFIDMDEGRNNRTVERRVKDALKHDRARIQVGRISHFGLLEMSRQRIRSSVLESSTEKCPVCGGLGHVRSVSSVALQLLRAIEETLIKGATHNLAVRTRAEVALYVLNHKRAHLRVLEERFRITITVSADAAVTGQQSYVIDRGEQVHTPEAARALVAQAQAATPAVVEDEETDYVEPEVEETAAEASEERADAEESEATPGEREGEPRRRRRRRGRGRGRGGEGREPREGAPAQFAQDNAAGHDVAQEDHDAGAPEEDDGGGTEPREGAATGNGQSDDQDGRRRRRRGRRGGRRNRHRNGDNNQGNGGEYGEHDRPASFEGGVHETSEGAPHPVLSDEDATVMAPPFPQPSPVHAEAPVPPPAAEPSHEPAPRRRSTIREPAPVSSPAETAAPAPQPAPVSASEPVVSSTSDEPSAPKRGWWGKRLLGDK
ncbi:MAG TPA: Rne/Rng family ribonuclease [Pseudolabrys sp.]|nr:Rne/Rng family ribonuclease [Pseudolabrys sp.]